MKDFKQIRKEEVIGYLMSKIEVIAFVLAIEDIYCSGLIYMSTKTIDEIVDILAEDSVAFYVEKGI